MGDGYTFNWTPEGRRLKKAVDELKELAVGVGYQRGKVTHKPKEKGQAEADMADVAAWNEFGTSKIPARPFLRTSIDMHSDEIQEDLKNACEMILNGATPEQALNMVGAQHVGRVQETIVSGSFAPNAPSTIRKKGSDKPLIDTGQLRQSVHYIVKPKGDFK